MWVLNESTNALPPCTPPSHTETQPWSTVQGALTALGSTARSSPVTAGGGSRGPLCSAPGFRPGSGDAGMTRRGAHSQGSTVTWKEATSGRITARSICCRHTDTAVWEPARGRGASSAGSTCAGACRRPHLSRQRRDTESWGGGDV